MPFAVFLWAKVSKKKHLNSIYIFPLTNTLRGNCQAFQWQCFHSLHVDRNWCFVSLWLVPCMWEISHLHVCCFIGKLNTLRPSSTLHWMNFCLYKVCWSHNSINQTQSRASLSTTSTPAPCKPVLCANFPYHIKKSWSVKWKLINRFMLCMLQSPSK